MAQNCKVIDGSNSNFYCPQTGVYSSKHPTVLLPQEPILDVVSYILSHTHKGMTALVDSSSDASILYPQFFQMVKSLASGLQKAGVNQGDVVLLLMNNSINYPVVFLSILYLGGIVSPMNPLSSIAEIQKQVKELNPRLIFSNSENATTLASFKIPLVSVPADSTYNEKIGKYESFYNLIHNGDSNSFIKPKIHQDDDAAIFYSSGTTGTSKGVILTHKNIISAIITIKFEASLYDSLPIDAVYLAIVPMFHIYGMIYFVTGLFSLGSCVVVMKKFDADEAVKAIDRFRVTHYFLVPPMLAALTRSAAKSGSQLMSLKQVCCGAAPIPPKAIQNFIEQFPHVDFIQGYGMTESPGVVVRGYNKGFVKHASVGLLSVNGQAKIVDPDTGSFLPPGNIGEICLRGTGVMKGYLNNKIATAEAIDEDGWLHTGDIGYFDQDGYMFIVDRLKDTIKYKGFQISPVQIENILIRHPEIVDAAVVGLPAGEIGEIVAAFVVREPGSFLSKAAIMDYVSAQVSPYKKVREVFFTESIPRTASGKILRRALRNSLSKL